MYISPSVKAQVYRRNIPGNSALIFKLVQRLLPSVGYKIASVDPATGMITTIPVEMTVDADACDCGSAMGLPVVKTGGIKVRVYFEIGLQGNEMVINAVITPEFSSTFAALYAGMNIQCISKGNIEEQLAKNILKSIKIPENPFF
jgi:hypothetical protein